MTDSRECDKAKSNLASDEEAIISAVKSAQLNGGAKSEGIDAVAGASMGVEGIIELGRRSLAKETPNR